MAIGRQRLSPEENILQMSAPAVATLISCKAIEHGLSCGPLHIHVETGVDPQAAFVYLIGAIFVLQITAQFFYEIRCERIRIRSDVQAQWRTASCLGFTRCDLSILQHVVDDQIAAVLRPLRMIDGRIERRRFWQTCNQRSFWKSEFLCCFAEIKFRCSFKSIDAVPKINLVGVQSENLLLGESPLNLDRQQCLLNLAMKRPVRRQKQVA